jgi:ElaB/YqjD/DUF883 family membrane-anchored ribosome-binding protein
MNSSDQESQGTIHPSSKSFGKGALSDLSQQSQKIVEDVKDLGQIARSTASRGADELQQKGRDLAATARERAGKYEDRALEYIQQRPMKSVLMALGIGALFGLWMRR